MNKNTLMLIEKIIINKFLSLSQLMHETTFTKRQIEYQIQTINDILSAHYHLPEINQLRLNQAVTSETLILLREVLFNNVKHYQFNHEERQLYIYIAILCNQDYLTLYHLTDELKVGKTTIQADLKELKQKLTATEIDITSDRTYGYTLSGSAASIQKYLIDHINSVNLTVIKYFFRIRSIDLANKYKEEILHFAEDYGFSFVESRLEEFVYILVFFALNPRLQKRKNLNISAVISEKLSLSNEYQFAGALMAWLDLELSRENLEYISAWLIGISVSNIRANTPDQPYIIELLKHLMLRFQALSGLQYTDFQAALAQLYAHFRPAFYRIAFNLPVSNPLTKQILKEYSTTAILIRETVKPLSFFLSSPVSDDELAYLIVHFASLSGQKSIARLYRKKGAILCNSGIGFSALLKKQLSDLFPEFDFYTSGYKTLKKDILLQKYDAVFSTLLDLDSDDITIPVFYISSLLTNQDKYLLSQKVYKVFESFNESPPSIHDLIAIINKYAQISSENKLRGELINFFSPKCSQPEASEPYTLTDLIKPHLIQTKVSARTAKEAVLLSAQPLLEYGYITPAYLDAIIEVFEKSPYHTVIMKSVALPHAAPDKGALKPGISILVLDDPIIFEQAEYDPIRYIFCLAAVDYDSHIAAMAKLVEFLEDRNFYDVLDFRDCFGIYNYLLR